MDSGLQRLLSKYADYGIKRDVPLCGYTSFKAGGAAAAFAETDDPDTILNITRFCRNNGVKYIIIGGGTNILVSDKGFAGLVLRFFSNKPCKINPNGEVIVNAGIPLSHAARFAMDNALAGMEALAGIPGSVGGAVYMNAGAYGTEIKDVLSYAQVMYQDKTVTLNAEVLRMSYRDSILQKDFGIVTEAAFRLKPGDPAEIKQKTDEYAANRRAKQPLDLPSAGSTFKRPPGYFAAKLIEDCGLKGHTVGGAMVSEKHAGFIVNKGGASAADIYKLIAYVKEEVQKRTGVLLEPEIRFIGEFP